MRKKVSCQNCEYFYDLLQSIDDYDPIRTENCEPEECADCNSYDIYEEKPLSFKKGFKEREEDV